MASDWRTEDLHNDSAKQVSPREISRRKPVHQTPWTISELECALTMIIRAFACVIARISFRRCVIRPAIRCAAAAHPRAWDVLHRARSRPMMAIPTPAYPNGQPSPRSGVQALSPVDDAGRAAAGRLAGNLMACAPPRPMEP